MHAPEPLVKILMMTAGGMLAGFSCLRVWYLRTPTCHYEPNSSEIQTDFKHDVRSTRLTDIVFRLLRSRSCGRVYGVKSIACRGAQLIIKQTGLGPEAVARLSLFSGWQPR